MKRFIIFFWMGFEQGGGWNDVHRDATGATASFDTQKEAEMHVQIFMNEQRRGYLYQIVDLESGQDVADQVVAEK